MRFHLLALAHLPQHKKFNHCAYSMKNRRLARMLTSLGHDVFFYGSEGSDVEKYCSSDRLHFVETHKLADIRADYGEGWNLDDYPSVGYDTGAHQFRHDWNQPPKPSTVKFRRSCIEHINRVKRPDDFLLLTQGNWHLPIAEATGLYLKCEPGIGYTGSVRGHFRAFESSYMQNFAYGSECPFQSVNGANYDRVIPNYFDPDDFEYSDQKDDYLLYIGRLIIRKGIMAAYKASEALKMRLVIAGQGGHVDHRGFLVPNDHNEFELPPGNWEYVGAINVEQRKPLMAHATATFVLTDYLEPFAGTHIESMLSGTPAITTNFGVFPGTVINGLNGWRCNTLDDIVWAVRQAPKLDTARIRQSAERYLMDNVKWEFQRWFDDLMCVYESATIPNGRQGYLHLRLEEPEWRKRIYW